MTPTPDDIEAAIEKAKAAAPFPPPGTAIIVRARTEIHLPPFPPCLLA